MGCGPSHDLSANEPRSVPLPPMMQSMNGPPPEIADQQSSDKPSKSFSHPEGQPTPLANNEGLRKRGSVIHHLVSKKKVRFEKDGFDLDLAYITPRLVAMGYPSTGSEAWYRNPAEQVRLFLEHYHPQRAKVYNLCGEPERIYPASLLGLPPQLVERYIAFDHNPCPLVCVAPFCESVAAWLAEDSGNVAAIHCKAGKGRTGMLICCFLVWCGTHEAAADAMAFYGKKRTSNGKGVTIPSQRRYVEYTEQLRKGSVPLQTPPMLLLEKVSLLNAPDWATAAGCHFTVELVQLQAKSYALNVDPSNPAGHPPPACPEWRAWEVFDSRRPAAPPRETAATDRERESSETRERLKSAAQLNPQANLSTGTLGASTQSDIGTPPSAEASASAGGVGGSDGNVVTMTCGEAAQRPLLAGDVKLTITGPKGKMAAFWFHTAFVSDGGLRLAKGELDKACKEKKLYRDDFGVAVTFSQPAEEDTESCRLRLQSMLSSSSMKL